MRWVVLSLLALAACGEPSSIHRSPTDRFTFPSAVALTARQGGGVALLVASGNYDLSFDGADGGTVLSVDPAVCVLDGLGGCSSGGSAGRPGGALAPLGEGAHVGSFTGELVVADAATCPKADAASQAPEALVATRYTDQVWRLPMGLDGSLGPCTGAGCVVPVEPRLHDPFGVTLACRTDKLRRSAFVSYLREAPLDTNFLQAWVAQVDLDDPASPSRAIPVGGGALAGMAYDAAADRLFVLGRPLLAAPVWMFDLTPCPGALADCPMPVATMVDLAQTVGGLDPQSIALSNPQAGRPRRAYVSARVYDPALANLLGVRPGGDLGAVLVVLDLEEGLDGRPTLRVLDVVPVGLGASQVKVLPARPGLRDLVVVSGAAEGVVTIFDDEAGQVARVIPIDEATGAPEAGRAPYGLAVQPLPGGVARVYVAASQQAVVGIIDVPLARPGQAAALRDGAGALVRIGGLQ